VYECFLLMAGDRAQPGTLERSGAAPISALVTVPQAEVTMLRTSLLLALIVCLADTAAAQIAAEEVLPAGTLLQCTLDEPNFSSRTAQVGDPVLCHVGALAVFGHSVFPRGAYLAGRFQEYRDPGRLVGKGWVELAFDRLVLPGAVTLPVSAKVISVPRLRVNREGKIQGSGHPKRDAVGWAIPVLWPLKVLTLPARGPRPTLNGELRITLRLLEDVGVPTTVITSRTTSSTPQTQRLRPMSGSALLRQPVYAGSTVPSEASSTSELAPTHEQLETLRSNYFSEDPSGPRLTWLILKDGTAYLARNYWLESGKLQCVTLDWERKLIPLARLDLDETIRLNREGNVEFVIRSRER
jgi:hypothetical protein